MSIRAIWEKYAWQRAQIARQQHFRGLWPPEKDRHRTDGVAYPIRIQDGTEIATDESRNCQVNKTRQGQQNQAGLQRKCFAPGSCLAHTRKQSVTYSCRCRSRPARIDHRHLYEPV